ncbi:LOW QUALITY PROTEIN: hypothetical protein V1477_016737 [Vespula maculifrons]|uniref:Uncharacterized protein n=1 Tax=Vespula maculifrons TaxID=7453 RepID=A0ABD2B460_VESMC
MSNILFVLLKFNVIVTLGTRKGTVLFPNLGIKTYKYCNMEISYPYLFAIIKLLIFKRILESNNKIQVM